ncbi:PilZ domain-containing protein [Treponema sp.]|uniref:PilZ domain-containing protein n=1 Tax=Treponema sp. TaxID=166 RepID=UPI00298DA6E9|nr:PilZ domain-containing protein [Treponema sp.]
MPVLISAILIVIFSYALYRGYMGSKNKLSFFAQGFDYGFKRKDISVLWKLASQCEIEEPLDLYVSENAVNKCIAKVIDDAKAKGELNSYPVQVFLDKLYRFKTRVVLDLDNKRGLESTKSLDVGQKLSIILKGHGVFYSHVINNGRELIISLPVQVNKITRKIESMPGEDWEGKTISVYFWRKNDAGYAFDTEVFGSGVFRSDKALYLKHSYKLDRAQKRQSIRVPCEIYAQMYIIKDEVVDYEKIETELGYKCLLEDLSEDGAMIRIGGMGKNNVQIKIQFELNEMLIIMFGVIRAVEFNETLNQSRLHFECTHIEQGMKNAILSYVYKVIPQEQKDINEAIAQAESFKNEESDISNPDGKPAVAMARKNAFALASDSEISNSTIGKIVLSEDDEEPSPEMVNISRRGQVSSENSFASEIGSLPKI